MRKLYENSWALIIAVGKLKDSKSPFKTILNPINDAKAIENMLKTKCDFPEENIYSLIEQEATFQHLDEMVEGTLAEKINKKDRLLIFFAGHAITRPKRGHKLDAEGYFVPFDAEWTSPEKVKWPTLKSMNGFVKQINDNVEANQILFLFDCCFSGIAGKPQEYDSQDKATSIFMRDAAIKSQSVQIITASNRDEPVIDSGKDKQHSIFTQAILDFINNEKANEYPEMFISAKKMAVSITSTVVSESMVWGKGRRQEPQFYRADFDKLGEFVVKEFEDSEKENIKEDEIVLNNTDKLLYKAGLLKLLETNDIITQINKELEKEPEKKLTVSSFFILIKKQLQKDIFVKTQIEELQTKESLSNDTVEELWNHLSMNLLIRGIKPPSYVNPLIPDEKMMKKKNKVERNEDSQHE